MDPLSINLIFALLIILFFFIQGASSFREIHNSETYFLANRTLKSNAYARSFAAASTSLATVLFFFVTLGVQFGIYILFAPITYIFGSYLYCKVVLPPLEDQGFFKGNSTNNQLLGTTLGNYIGERYNSSAIKYSIIFITLLGMLSILLIELYVGVTVFSIYFKPQYVNYALIFISVIVFLYTSFGGIIAVIKTDRSQFNLILISTLILLFWLIYHSINSNNTPNINDFFIDILPLKAGFLLPYPLLFNILIVNILLIPSLLRTWQMAAASPNVNSVKKGIMNGVWFTTILTTSFVFIGIFFFKSVFSGADISLNGILTTLSKSQISFVSYIVFPLFFGSCLAALISTADSALIPITQSLYQDFSKNKDWNYKKVFILNFALLAVALILYLIVFKLLDFNLINWLFTIFSLLIIGSPCIIFAVLAPKKLLIKRSIKIAVLISIWGGLLIAILLSIIGNKLNIVGIVQLNSPLAVLFGTFAIIIVWLFSKNKRN